MLDCPVCAGRLGPVELRCGDCNLVLQGSFTLPRLARLPAEMRALGEQLILCGGNLKQLATQIGISYPTLRRRVDQMIAALERLKADDEIRIKEILENVESGHLKSAEGVRMIRELQDEL
ncbi:MAG: DUF2089 family protein [Azoarcus sp.]|nr:DUF2089 family protein [Azoarcus sp.]